MQFCIPVDAIVMNLKSLKPEMCRITCKFGSSLFRVVTPCILVVAYRRFGTAYRSLFQGPWTAGTLKMRLVGCPETSVNGYQNALLNDP